MLDFTKEFNDIKIGSAVFWYIFTMAIVIISAYIIGDVDLLNNNNLLSNSIIKLIKSSNSTDKNKMLRSNTNLNVNLSSDNNKSESDIKNIYLIIIL